MMSQVHVLRCQDKYALAERLRPQYRTASRTQKTALLDAFVQLTGYARKSALRVLHHAAAIPVPIPRPRSPLYGPEVQQALFLAWRSAQYICARRLLPALPALVEALERFGHLQLADEDRRRLLAMSIPTAERLLRTQPKPRLHGLSATTSGRLSKSQLPVCLCAPWEEDRPGFVEVDLVAHCGGSISGRFLYTMTLTDLATGWTECIPLLSKSADAVVAALSQARVLFPFPLLGIDTDNGSEFLNEHVLDYCKQHHLTLTRGRPWVKNDQAHVEQKNGAVVRKAVGCERLEGERAYEDLRRVYQVLRLVVNCVQPSVKVQEKVLQGERVRRVYDVAQTPLQRTLACGIFSDARQQEVSAWAGQLDPLALSERLDLVQQALWTHARLSPTADAQRTAWPMPEAPALVQQESYSLSLTPSAQMEASPENHVQKPVEPDQAPPLPCSHSAVSETRILSRLPLERAIATFLEERCEAQRRPKTLTWHRTSLQAMQRFMWEQFALSEIHELSCEALSAWLSELHTVPSQFTGKARSVRTIAASSRSVRAFCNWLVRKGLVDVSPFPPGAVPRTSDRVPQVVEANAFARLLEACHSSETHGCRDRGMVARNRALLWLLLETGLPVSELCALRLSEVDTEAGVVTVCSKENHPRVFPLSPDAQRAVKEYLEQARLTRAWTPTRPEDEELLWLTQGRTPLTINGITLLFQRLNQRAGFTRTPICPSRLRETYAIRFLQAGGEVAALQEQLGVADFVSVRRYERFCQKQRKREQRAQKRSEEDLNSGQTKRNLTGS